MPARGKSTTQPRNSSARRKGADGRAIGAPRGVSYFVRFSLLSRFRAESEAPSSRQGSLVEPRRVLGPVWPAARGGGAKANKMGGRRRSSLRLFALSHHFCPARATGGPRTLWTSYGLLPRGLLRTLRFAGNSPPELPRAPRGSLGALRGIPMARNRKLRRTECEAPQRRP